MKRFAQITCFFIFSLQYVVAQSNILNAKNPDEIGKKTEEQVAYDANQAPLAYPYVDDKDVVWSKVVYEEIDLSQRFNFPLLYPTDDALYTDERKSLWRIIYESLEKGLIENVYQRNNRNFTETYSREEFMQFLKTSVNIGGIVQEDRVESHQITAYRIKGLWYFDKKYGELRYRLLAIMPIGRDLLNENDQDYNTPLFWLWYRDLRPILHKELVFSDKNNAKRISFDQLLTSRRFHSYLFAVDNVMNDRTLDEMPTIADDPYLRLVESERLKQSIRDFELDMWND